MGVFEVGIVVGVRGGAAGSLGFPLKPLGHFLLLAFLSLLLLLTFFESLWAATWHISSGNEDRPTLDLTNQSRAARILSYELWLSLELPARAATTTTAAAATPAAAERVAPAAKAAATAGWFGPSFVHIHGTAMEFGAI